MDYMLFRPAGDFDALALADVTLLGMLFVLPVVALAAVLYWAYASGKVQASFGTLALGYVGGLFLALLLPTLTMGAVGVPRRATHGSTPTAADGSRSSSSS